MKNHVYSSSTSSSSPSSSILFSSVSGSSARILKEPSFAQTANIRNLEKSFINFTRQSHQKFTPEPSILNFITIYVHLNISDSRVHGQTIDDTRGVYGNFFTGSLIDLTINPWGMRTPTFGYAKI